MEYQVTFDYLCPFARNAAEAVLAADGATHGVARRFRPFSLSQVHLGEADTPVWHQPEGRSGVLALQWGIAARDALPEAFPAVHQALFAARHDEGEDINDEEVVRRAIGRTGTDPDALAPLVASGRPLETLCEEHVEAVERWGVFGVPTFLSEDEALFVRMMERGRVDDLEQVLELLPRARLNELKRPRVPR